MKPISEIFPLLAERRKIMITTHQKPDGDAMGSMLGLYHFLIQFGHDVTPVSPTNWADFLSWMPGTEQVLDFERNVEKVKTIANDADWIFCLDFNVITRTRNLAPVVAASKAEKILIDHHQQPDEAFFAYGVSDISKSSTCEMVYDFIIESGHEDKINDLISQSLYSGTMTDTGSFRFPSTSANVHRMVAGFMDKGLQPSFIHENLFDTSSESRLRFFGNVLLNRMEVFYEYNTALISVPHADLLKYEIKTGDTEGLVNYPLSIQGIRLAAIIIDRGDERKLSFRSKGDFDVNVFARKYFNGGGHKNASGGQSDKPIAAVVQDFLAAMRDNRLELADSNIRNKTKNK